MTRTTIRASKCKYEQDAGHVVTREFDKQMKLIQKYINECAKDCCSDKEVATFNARIREKIVHMVSSNLTSYLGMNDCNLLVGMGGSHVWIANGNTGERVAIFYIK